MNPQVLKAFLRSGIFIAGLALLLMLATKRNSPAFVVSTCSFLIGLASIGSVWFVAWVTRR